MVTNVLSYLENAARCAPQRYALADETRAFSYVEVWQRACAIGSGLSRLLKGARNRPILVSVERSAAVPVAFLGVVCSGNFYVPLDLSLPQKRLRDIYETMQPAAVLFTSPAEETACFEGCPCATLEELSAQPVDPLLAQKTLQAMVDTDPLYCIFTSGSTGVPKGVLVSHRSVIDMVEQFSAAFSFDGDTVFGNQAPFDFDVSVKDIFLALRCCGRVEVLEKPLFLMPKRLIERLNERRVNTLIWAAAAMKVVSALRTFEKIRPLFLRRVMFSGEVLPCKVLNDWRAALPDARFVNLYGPTEITCNCTYYPVEESFADDALLPIGRPFVNSRVFLLRDGQEVTDCGEVGEVCVRGSCLALGYYANAEKTAEAFCQNPLVSAYPERIYRTGDLAKWLPDGNLLFVGRADSQVKHMGHRIELGEIEVAVNALPEVRYACCLYDAQREKLVLFYEAEELEPRALLARLKPLLPDYMRPNRLVALEKMPANRTGKIDRALLRRQYIL